MLVRLESGGLSGGACSRGRRRRHWCRPRRRRRCGAPVAGGGGGGDGDGAGARPLRYNRAFDLALVSTSDIPIFTHKTGSWWI